MTDIFRTARRNMVLSQVNTDNVTDRRLQKAMETVPRELFVPHTKRTAAYSSDNIEIGGGRFLLAPRTLGKMIQACEIAPDDEILVVGSSSGYAAAVMAHMATVVVALESDAALADGATSLLLDLGIDNAAVVTGDLPAGHKKGAPYDVIFIDGAVHTVPDELEQQLKEGGRLVTLKQRGPLCSCVLMVRSGETTTGRAIFDAAGGILPGFEQVEEFTF